MVAERDGVAGLETAGTFEACGRQACAIMALHERLVPLLQERQLEPLYREVEIPLLEVLADMERAGLAVDLACLSELWRTMDAKLAALTDELYTLAGTTFNLKSPKQLAAVLFDRLSLPVVKRTKTGPSTDADVLRQLARQHPLPARLIEYRELSKLMST